MKLHIFTPLDVIVDEDGVLALRAEDATGSFGILPHHAAFLTSLTVSVVTWQSADRTRRYCAVRHGVFTVNAARDVAIATREAVLGIDLATLDKVVLARFGHDLAAEQSEHSASTRLHLNAIRQMVNHLQPRGGGAFA